MSDKVQLIRQEIKRRIKNLEFSLENNCVEKHSKLDILGNITTLESLLQFIDSLPKEPVSEDLEEYYKKEFLPKEWFANPGQRTISQFNFFTAQHFAEWQKQQMMKNDVHAWVNTYESVENPYDNQVSFITNLSPSKFRNEETAQIIVVKIEQQ